MLRQPRKSDETIDIIYARNLSSRQLAQVSFGRMQTSRRKNIFWIIKFAWSRVVLDFGGMIKDANVLKSGFFVMKENASDQFVFNAMWGAFLSLTGHCSGFKDILDQLRIFRLSVKWVWIYPKRNILEKSFGS